MAANTPLKGFKVLVTRPKQQAKDLCDLIVQAGGEPIAFPVIDIMPIDQKQWSEVMLTELDMIIFVSRNAVTNFVSGIKQPLPDAVQLVSVGDGSAASMRSHGLRVDIQPEQSIGSEGLLLMPELESMAGKKVLIVRGKGGRELLANTLEQRGAHVHYVEVYQRTLPTPSALQCQQALTADFLVCTSVAGVKNLTVLLQKGLKSLLDKPMLVISERIKDYAVSLGFEHVLVTKDTNDNAVIEQLIKMETV